MADKTDDMLISMSVDLAVIRRAMKKLEGDIAATSGNVVKKFEAMGKGIDNSMVTAMQARIDKMTGVGVKAAKEWNGALSQQGAELDKLRQKYNPVFAAVNSYKAAVFDIQRAHNLGALSADEMAAAIQRERKATLDSIAAIKGRNTALAQRPAREPVNQFNTANLAAQFQDIAVTTAMGMSPLQIALQQGTQISAVLGPMGAAGAVKSLSEAFLSVINPVSLATIGLVAGTAAAVQFFMTTEQGAKTVDEVLKQHEQNIQLLGPAYEEALKKQKQYIDQSAELIDLRFQKDASEAQKSLINEVRKSLLELAKLEGFATFGSKLEPARKAIENFQASVASGTPKAKALQEEVAKLSATKGLDPEIAASIVAATDAVVASENKISGMQKSLDPYAAALSKISEKIDGISSDKARKEIEGLWEKVRGGDAAVTTLINAINRLSLTNPDLSSAKDELQSFIDKALQAQSVASGFARTTPKSSRNAVEPLNDADFNKRFDNPYDKLREELKRQKSDLEKKPKRSSGERKAERDANAYRDLVKSAQDRIDQMQLEEQLIGKTGVAADTLRMRLDLLQRAQDKGRELSPSQQKELEALAHAYGEAAQKVAALSAAEELRFEREQMFRSPAEQRVAGQLRNMGLDANSDFGQLIAGQIRLNEKLAEGRDMAKDFVSGFTQDLLNGVSAMDALANAASRLGSKLLDMAMDQAINGLFGNLMGVFSGGLGGGSPFTNSGQLAGAFASGIGGMWAEGGYTGSGGKYDPAGIVHKGEYVIPKWLVDKIGVGNIERLFAGYSSGGLVGASVPSAPTLRAPRVPDIRMPNQSERASEGGKVDINVNVSGARGNSEIQQMVADGVSQGLQQYDREMLPQRFRQIARDPYAVG